VQGIRVMLECEACHRLWDANRSDLVESTYEAALGLVQ
jgi:hypothetical protein